MKRRLIVLSVIMVFLTGGCNNKRPEDDNNAKLSSETLADINRQLVIKESERISSYIKRKNLEMRETATGLWVSDNFSGSKGEIKQGDIVELEYTCSLLDGTLIYDSSADGTMRFEVGKSDKPAGLEEGVKLMKEGSEGIIIVPEYLGYGLLGDKKRIPARSTLVYKIKITGVK